MAVGGDGVLVRGRKKGGYRGEGDVGGIWEGMQKLWTYIELVVVAAKAVEEKMSVDLESTVNR